MKKQFLLYGSFLCFASMFADLRGMEGIKWDEYPKKVGRTSFVGAITTDLTNGIYDGNPIMNAGPLLERLESTVQAWLSSEISYPFNATDIIKEILKPVNDALELMGHPRIQYPTAAPSHGFGGGGGLGGGVGVGDRGFYERSGAGGGGGGGSSVPHTVTTANQQGPLDLTRALAALQPAVRTATHSTPARACGAGSSSSGGDDTEAYVFGRTVQDVWNNTAELGHETQVAVVIGHIMGRLGIDDRALILEVTALDQTLLQQIYNGLEHYAEQYHGRGKGIQIKNFLEVIGATDRNEPVPVPADNQKKKQQWEADRAITAQNEKEYQETKKKDKEKEKGKNIQDTVEDEDEVPAQAMSLSATENSNSGSPGSATAQEFARRWAEAHIVFGPMTGPAFVADRIIDMLKIINIDEHRDDELPTILAEVRIVLDEWQKERTAIEYNAALDRIAAGMRAAVGAILKTYRK